MSNAAKHRKKAAEFEQLKQIDRAIASYVKAIEESEAAGEDVDVALFNKVGDLALRQGRVPDAITYYERAVEHYATSGLFNNAIALCNKILRNAPGRANVYFTLGRICARKGLRGDATRNFLEYATRMQQEGRIEEGIRALAEVADLMPELTDVRTLVDEHAARAGIVLPRRRTPIRTDRIATPSSNAAVRDARSQDLVFLDVDYGQPVRATPVTVPRTPTPVATPTVPTPSNDLPFLSLTPPSARAIPEPEPPVSAPHRASPIEPVVPPPAGIELNTVAPLEAVSEFAVEPLQVEPLVDVPPDGPFADAPPAVAPIEGLEENGEFGDPGTALPAEGFTPEDEWLPADDAGRAGHETDVTWLVPAADDVAPLPEVIAENFDDATDDPGVSQVIFTETPPFVPAVADVAPSLPTPPFVEVLESVEENLPPFRPPFRLDPHDFILPGELPPLLLEDEFVQAGLDAVLASSAPVPTDEVPPAEPVAVPTIDLVADVLETIVSTPIGVEAVPAPAAEAPAVVAASPADGAEPQPGPDGAADDAAAGATADAEDDRAARSVSLTPALPIAAVAMEAQTVASSRRDSLRAAVARLPQNWLLRRRLAEALFEAGEREAALAELETAQQGLMNAGEYPAAMDIGDELVHVSPDHVPYHQRRVELAVRTNDQQRLRAAYLDLADALVRMGEEGRARAVYARVLEIDPADDRARAALGAAAPPPPAPRPDDEFVDLADWLRDDDAPVSTRMRMREPVISGDEQADFDALLRHFKAGVSRSLGEDDFEGHYDLGVAYKEMGLLEDAIAEFQKALRSRSHRLPAYEALGQCFVEQERHQVAATVLSRALHEPGLDDEQRIGVLYLLAYSCEALQRRDEARSYYQRVYAIDINFRDVAARMAALEQVSR